MSNDEREQHPGHEDVERNLRLYPWYVFCVNACFWMPVFFLLLTSIVPLSQVLVLEAIYYLVVVVVEVPSGYLSDRLGRRPTLLVAASALLTSYVLFAVATDFATLALAELFLAVGFACNSGTDTSFHHDSLLACDRADEYGAREAVASRVTFRALALSALVGGAAATFDLRVAYVLSALAAAAALGLVLRAVEPPRSEDAERATTFLRQLLRAARAVTRPPLTWLFLVAVVATVLNHLPWEFYQGYLAALAAEGSTMLRPDATPLTTGVHAALAAAIGALAGGRSIALRRRVGLRPLLLASVVLQTGIVAAMAWFFHPVVAVLLLARSTPSALQRAPLREAIVPRISTSLRATYLSMQSLAGRLAYGLSLLVLAGPATDSDGLGYDELAVPLRTATWIALGCLVVLALTALWSRRRAVDDDIT